VFRYGLDVTSFRFGTPLATKGVYSLKTNGAGAPVRILVVDDHKPFRRFVSSTLHEQTNLEVIGEAQDGLDAVHQAEALQPDLILLDIGLPRLNGIEAARRIGDLAPNARIIFLTLDSSADVVQGALSLGAWGYVVKTQAGQELLMAVESVRQGKQFVSSGLDGHGDPSAACRQIPGEGVTT
jgi:DNA-binding NarL/FixJ family response regulator